MGRLSELPTEEYQNLCPRIHQLCYLATPQAEHKVHSPEILACCYAPKHDHFHHSIPGRKEPRLKCSKWTE